MPGYFIGDELGAIKSVKYTKQENEWKSTSTVLLGGSFTGKSRAIQKLAAFNELNGTETLLAAARADGSASVLTVSENGAEIVSEWKEPRLKEGQRYIGLASTKSGVYSCTSNGALRLTKPGEDDGTAHSETSILPMRLSEWRLSSNEETFAYAGDEVELSVWNTEQAFAAKSSSNDASGFPSEQSKKRKRSEQLLPGEIWRAKNLSNDELNLRQPVRNTALTYIQPSSSVSEQHHLLVGTQFGDLRRYDTRAARRPVANWKGIGKVGAIGVVERGLAEYEAFVTDHGCNLFAVDLRNGKVIYGYQGLSGAITSLAPSRSMLASVSQDRFLRLHSTCPPPAQAGERQDEKGEVLDKLYMKVVPTVVVVDNSMVELVEAAQDDDDKEEDDEDNVWEGMEAVESDQEEDKRHKAAHRERKKIRAQ